MTIDSIRQGDVFWADLEDPKGSAPGFRRPMVVAQSDVFNESKIQTVVVCAVTSNMARAKVPGNVSLKKGEAGLSKESVINVTQIVTLDKASLAQKIGKLSPAKREQMIRGIRQMIEG